MSCHIQYICQNHQDRQYMSCSSGPDCNCQLAVDRQRLSAGSRAEEAVLCQLAAGQKKLFSVSWQQGRRSYSLSAGSRAEEAVICQLVAGQKKLFSVSWQPGQRSCYLSTAMSPWNLPFCHVCTNEKDVFSPSHLRLNGGRVNCRVG